MHYKKVYLLTPQIFGTLTLEIALLITNTLSTKLSEKSIGRKPPNEVEDAVSSHANFQRLSYGVERKSLPTTYISNFNQPIIC